MKKYSTQKYAIKETLKHLKEGKKRIINVQFCGLGKTELGAWICKHIKGNILFLVHKTSILYQAYETYRDIHKGESFGIFTSDLKQTDKKFIFASVQTLRNKKNLKKFSKDYFDCIIVDECHHMITNSYKGVLDYFDYKKRYLFGFTATPMRLDKKNIFNFFEENVGFYDEGNDISARVGITRGLLSPIEYIGLWDNIDYNKIYHNGYKYNKKDLDKSLIIKKRNKKVVKEYLKEAKGKKTIVFCNSIKHINSLLKEFKNININAVGLSYKVSKKKQKNIEKQFREGEIDVILSVDLYIEGVDFPDCECIMFCRPTESERIFIQQLGRVMRISEGKRRGLILDFIGNQKHGLRNRLGWLKKIFNLKEKNGRTKGRIIVPKSRKPLHYYDPVINIHFKKEVVDIFNREIKDEYKTLKQAIEEYHKIYKSKPFRLQLYKENQWIYFHFLKNNLLNKYCLSNKCKTLKQAIEEYHKIYKSKPYRNQLQKENPWIYQHFLKNNLLNKYCLKKIKEKTNLKQAIEEYHKIYKSKPYRRQLYKENRWIHYHFKLNKLLDKYCLLNKYKTLKQAIEEYHKIYKSKPYRKQLQKENQWIYYHFKLNKLLDKYCFRKIKETKNLKQAIEEYHKIYKSKPYRSQLYKENQWIYQHFFKNNLLNKYCKPSRTLGKKK